MNVTIFASQAHTPKTSFTISKNLFNLVCATVGQAAKQGGLTEVARICERAAEAETLSLAEVSDENKAAFGLLLRQAINNGTILRKMYTWEVLDPDASMLLPENRTPGVIAFVHIHPQVLTLRYLTIYLDRYVRVNQQ